MKRGEIMSEADKWDVETSFELSAEPIQALGELLTPTVPPEPLKGLGRNLDGATGGRGCPCAPPVFGRGCLRGPGSGGAVRCATPPQSGPSGGAQPLSRLGAPLRPPAAGRLRGQRSLLR